MPLKPVDIASGDVAFLQYTGGTTGISKGAMLTHANLIANQMQISQWLDSGFTPRARPAVLNSLCALPTYPIFALTENSLMGLSTGRQNVLTDTTPVIPPTIPENMK